MHFEEGIGGLNVTHNLLCEQNNDEDVIDCLFAHLLWITSLLVHMLRDASKWPTDWRGANCAVQQLHGQTGLSRFRFKIIDQNTLYQADESMKRVKGSVNMLFRIFRMGCF